MSPIQALPSFNLALQSGHYRTVLPNLEYPSRPSTHIPWSSSSAPLIFSVSQTLFFFVFYCSLTFFSCPQKTTRPEISAASHNIQVSYTFLRSNSDTDVKPPSISFQTPTPNTCFDTCSVSGAFYGVGMFIWVRLIGVLWAFIFLIPCFL